MVKYLLDIDDTVWKNFKSMYLNEITGSNAILLIFKDFVSLDTSQQQYLFKKLYTQYQYLLGYRTPKRNLWVCTDIKKEKIAAKQRGELAPNWQGGLSFLPYCKKFNRALKLAIRKRDSYTCQLCGTKENKKALSVHHIHYDKQNCYPDLITLCLCCNNKVNKDRKEYETLFMNFLNTRELLFWTRTYDKNIIRN